MKELTEILSCRLSEKDLTPVEMLRLVKDVVNIIGDGRELTMPSVNEKLECLGWGREMMDFTSFELIVFLHEIEEGDGSIKTKPRSPDYLYRDCASVYV